MFILKLGVEALKNSDYGLSHECYTNEVKHSILKKLKCRRQFELKKALLKPKLQKHQKKKSILYNLLMQNHTKKMKPTSNIVKPTLSLLNDRPSSLNSEAMTPKSAESNHSRPSSAPQLFKFQISAHEALEISTGETLVLKWLKNIVEMKKIHLGIQTKFNSLDDCSKLTILKQNWHLLFTTYLAEFIQQKRQDVKSILRLLIKDYSKTIDNRNYKKIFRITRVLTGDLETLITQIIQLNMSSSLYNLLRLTICSIIAENKESDKNRYIELFKTCLSAQNMNFQNSVNFSQHHTVLSQFYTKQMDQLMDNLTKLDPTLMESTFYSHLTQNVDNVIEQIYWDF